MWIPVVLFVLWTVVFFSARYAFLRWRRWRYQQPARYINEIRGIQYYRSLGREQFERLVQQALKAGGYMILGEPYLGRTLQQGYAWKGGKKYALAHYPYDPLTPEDMEELSRKQTRARADQVLVFSPFPRAPRSPHPAVEVLAGSKLVDWFSILEDVRPPIVPLPDAGNCDCGAPMETRVNRAGQYLLVCSRYPDCREMRKPAAAVAGSKPEAEGRKPEAGGRKPEAGDRRQGAGDRRQEAGDRRQEAGDRRQEARGRRQ